MGGGGNGRGRSLPGDFHPSLRPRPLNPGTPTPPQTRSLSLRSSPVPKSHLQHPHRPAPHPPPAGSPGLVRGRKRLLMPVERSVPRIRCSGGFRGGKVVLGRGSGVARGQVGGDCGGPGRLGREGSGVQGGLPGDGKPRVPSGRLTVAGPGKEGGAGAVRAVCPPCSLQWELLRREGGLWEGWWCGWREVGGDCGDS